MFEAIGGRKFTMALIIIAAGVLVELYSKAGLGSEMAALLGAIYATFSTANTVITNKMVNSTLAAPAAKEVEEVEATTMQTAQEVNMAPVLAAMAQNNQQLSAILNQIGNELVKQQEANEQVLSALNAVQTSQATIQKGITVILQRGQA